VSTSTSSRPRPWPTTACPASWYATSSSVERRWRGDRTTSTFISKIQSDGRIPAGVA